MIIVFKDANAAAALLLLMVMVMVVVMMLVAAAARAALVVVCVVVGGRIHYTKPLCINVWLLLCAVCASKYVFLWQFPSQRGIEFAFGLQATVCSTHA